MQKLARQTRVSRSRKDHIKIKREIDSWLKGAGKTMKKKTETLLVTAKMVGLIYNSVNSLKSRWGQLHSHYSNMDTVIERSADKTRMMLSTFEMAADNPEYAGALLKHMASSALEIMLLNHQVER